MSPASKSKSKSKDKPSARAAKEQQKAFKPSGSTNAGSGSPASAYNPISGTFHTLETAAVASAQSPHNNGRFRNIDDTDDHSGSSHGTANEYDSVSNNGSSGDLEDLKEKIASTTLRQETVPGADNDKREKIRQKNERKHQRQRERRAQELHERCCGYLMSRKLEVLSQQLVAMGFSSERATLALILNEGKVEESVSWLFDGGEEEAQSKETNLESGGSLKIDITEELGRIAAMEIRYKCSKQEVERAVVASEGDLEKAEETIKTQKHETPLTSPKSEEAADTRNLTRLQEKQTASVIMQQRRNEREFNYTKGTAIVSGYPESVNRNPLPVKITQPKPLVEKRSWPATGPSLSVSYSLTSPVQVAPSAAKIEARNSAIGYDGRNIQQPVVREPVIMMQRPQSINAKQNLISGTSPPPGAAGWYPNNGLGFDFMKSNGNLLHNQSMGSFGAENPNSQRFYHPGDFKQQHQHQHQPMVSPVDIPAPRMGSSWNGMGASSSSLAVPSSLGLFSGWSSPGNMGSSSHLDWNTGGSMPQCDYTSIDWSLESSPLPSKPSGMWMGLSSLLKNSQGMRLNGPNGVHMSGSQEGGGAQEAASTNAGSREWTSPFAGKDMFSAPRQFVTSPSP